MKKIIIFVLFVSVSLFLYSEQIVDWFDSEDSDVIEKLIGKWDVRSKSGKGIANFTDTEVGEVGGFTFYKATVKIKDYPEMAIKYSVLRLKEDKITSKDKDVPYIVLGRMEAKDIEDLGSIKFKNNDLFLTENHKGISTYKRIK